MEELRYGHIASIYDEFADQKSRNQMDLLDKWFPGLIIQEMSSDGNTKKEAKYIDQEYLIHAVKYHGHFYSGGSTRISQITGRLIGTAKRNQEKERKTAELIQKHLAAVFVSNMDLTPSLKENVQRYLDSFDEDTLNEFGQTLLDLIFQLTDDRYALDELDRLSEPFAFDDEVFDGIIYDAAYQLELSTFDGLANAYLWLLTGSLLRNETGRVLRMYDSSFIAIYRQPSEDGTLKDKLNAMFHPEEYYYTYDGDDLDNRFPGIEWYCDKCGAHLNEQEGFDDHLDEWKCTKCGYVNHIGMDNIYENEEDAKNDVHHTDEAKFKGALKYRKKQLKKE